MSQSSGPADLPKAAPNCAASASRVVARLARTLRPGTPAGGTWQNGSVRTFGVIDSSFDAARYGMPALGSDGVV